MMKALLICDDYWHPGDVVEKGLAFLAEQGMALVVVKRPEEIAAQTLSDYQLVILSKSENTKHEADGVLWMNDAKEAELVSYVENGGGLLVTHSGTVPYKTSPRFTEMLGSRFTGHPEACPVTVTALKSHPVTQNTQTFTQTDEHYFLDVFAQDADIFMATSSVNGTQTGGYVRGHGRGRICVLTPGHLLEVWQHPSYQIMLKNAVDYCIAADA